MNMSSRMFEIRRCADGIVEFTADRMVWWERWGDLRTNQLLYGE